MCASDRAPSSSGSHRRRRTLVGALVALTALVVGPARVAAHTGFESSSPADGSVASAPVDVVTITFTGEATPFGDGFVALNGDGFTQLPVSVDVVEDRIFTLRFDPPLAGGDVGIRWNVQAADAHPIEGAFSFTVDAPAPTTAPPTTVAATTAGTTAATPAPTPTPTTLATVPPTTVPSTVAPLTTEVAGAATPTTPTTIVPQAQEATSLDEFLAVDNSSPGQTTATVGRVIGLLGVVLALGVFAFLATALRGHLYEVRGMLRAIRVLAGAIVLGGLIEYLGVSRMAGDGLGSTWSTAPGFAVVLRVVGAVGINAGLHGTISQGQLQRLVRRPSVMRSLSSAVVTPDDRTAGTEETEYVGEPIVRWRPDARAWPVFLGAALIVASFWLDGHTVSKGFRPLHALVNSVHVVAGAVWVGGVVSMAAIAWARHRHHEPMRIVELVVRFSKIATVALASVLAAGALMAVLVLDSPGELTGTPWGRILILKSAAVGLAMTGGAFNHFRLLPALEKDPDSPELLAELRSTVTAEAILLLFVVTVTAWLVAAAS